MRRLIPLLLLCCVSLPLLAQQEKNPQFKSFIVIIVDADPSIRDEVSATLEKSFSRLIGAEVVIFDPSWSGKSDWVISVSASVVPGKENEKQLLMGFAFSETVNTVEANALLARAERNNTIPFYQLKRDVEASRRGISDFRAMWVTLGAFPADLEPRCIEASGVFDKNLLAPARRFWERRKAENARSERSSPRRR